MYIHFQNDIAIISNDISDTEVAIAHILKTIKATLKFGLPVLLKFKDGNIDISKLRSKHFIANSEYAFINISLKNRFPIERVIQSPTEMVDYMLDLNDQIF
ncbi:hypothetical protein ABMA75_10730 [Halobacteriovorax sp. ZH4_bin.1]|uniref:hypothetical protein n=1 Tax=unclassified Halobacteriovorax TaxID=2639665 RepID=UPI00370F87FA